MGKSVFYICYVGQRLQDLIRRCAECAASNQSLFFMPLHKLSFPRWHHIIIRIYIAWTGITTYVSNSLATVIGEIFLTKLSTCLLFNHALFFLQNSLPSDNNSTAFYQTDVISGYFSVPVKNNVKISPCLAIFQNVVHSLIPGESLARRMSPSLLFQRYYRHAHY